jgi:transposase, IS5 family
MCNKNGAVTTDARVVLGDLIIKHHENLSDVDTIEAIAENIYMQYFLGLPSFKTEPVFAPSLFVEIRKRLGLDYWNEINEIIIKHNAPKKKDNDEPTVPPTNTCAERSRSKGTINIDATIVEQDIQYPTDLGILNESRKKLEDLVDVICAKTGQEKPRLYRIRARKQYLNVAKKKKRRYKIIRKAVGQQLNYVNRNLKKVELLLTDYDSIDWIFTKHELKYLQVIQEVYRQQRQTHSTKTHSTTDRIVSIHQPHVRPIVRGKAGANVEFGSKIGVCIHNGLTHLDHLFGIAIMKQKI